MAIAINGSGTITGISQGGLNDNIITKDEMATGGAWAPAGTVLQVVQGTYATPLSTTSGSYVASGLSATITPQSASNKILVLVDLVCYAGTANEGIATIYRNSTNLSNSAGFADWYAGTSDIITTCPLNYLDSPSTTSATTYSVYIRNNQSGSIQTNIRGNTSTIILLEIAA